jgi:hypothetical protein
MAESSGLIGSVAVEGAELLKASGLGGLPLMSGFVLTTAFVNLFIGSASAKWAVMAPVFVPMFMLLGYSPELTQAAYRIGDSVSNVVSPMMSYFALIVAFFERYDAKAGIGTVIATMLPYSLVFLLCWTALLLVWMALGLPLGPGPACACRPSPIGTCSGTSVTVRPRAKNGYIAARGEHALRQHRRCQERALRVLGPRAEEEGDHRGHAAREALRDHPTHRRPGSREPRVEGPGQEAADQGVGGRGRLPL